MTPSRDISRLIEIMAQLRTPVTGCPWDLEQNFETIAPYTIEEVFEVVDAIARGDFEDLKDELGDLLLQVVYHARMAEEQGSFDFGDVVEAITRKMIRRHPHVFADEGGNIAPAGVKSAWERIKAEEKAERAARRPPHESTSNSLLSGVKVGQPALTRALELQRKAGSVGFDWNDPRAVETIATNWPPRPETSCLQSSISRDMSAPILKWRCAAPTPNSNGASPISSARLPQRDEACRLQPSMKWMRCGTRRRRRKNTPRRRPQASDSVR